MPDAALTPWRAITMLENNDRDLKYVALAGQVHAKYVDHQLDAMFECLINCPNNVTHLNVSSNNLTDYSGFKIARFIKSSTTISVVSMGGNNFAEGTYLAIADALRVNTSLKVLHISGIPPPSPHIYAAFAEALRVNPVRPEGSFWQLIPGMPEPDFEVLKRMATASDANA